MFFSSSLIKVEQKDKSLFHELGGQWLFQILPEKNNLMETSEFDESQSIRSDTRAYDDGY